MFDRDVYEKYLRSKEWAKKRAAFIRSVPKKCSGCQKPYEKGFHVHHRTYKSLGNEPFRHLVLVCPECHYAIHRYASMYPRLSLWEATRKVLARKKLRVKKRSITKWPNKNKKKK